jgi:hypothetical protein
MDAGFKQAAGNFGMRLGGHSQTDSVYALDELAPVGAPLDFSFQGNLPRGRFVEIANGNKLRQTFRGKIGMDACVLPTEMAHADDCGAKWHSLLLSLFRLV